MIETERLLLRPHIADDFEACRAMWQDPAVVKYISGKPATEAEAWLRFLGYFGRWEIMGYGLFALIEKSTGQFMGEVGFSDFRRGLGPDFDPFHEAAWVLAEAGHGKGYAREAMKAAQNWLDEIFSPDKTVCIISPENGPSIALAKKLGFRATGEAAYNQNTVILFERLQPA
ncbi:GNAT family N-acetyltransferase [Parasphingorhabdus sp.]|uniref:GNAT family N-acetyltransferase n=1 Tax=Parasphingorhabdus sp. TaxID=2709688 RepID=UPI00309E136C